MSFIRTVLGIGFKGNTKAKINGKNKRSYDQWHNMLKRCYYKNCDDYKNYGEQGVTVCEDWLCFEQFEKDIPYIDGYDENLYNKGLLQLDKDKKQKDKPTNEKVYSKDTCCFITASENCKDGYRRSREAQKSRMTSFIAITPEGEEMLIKGLRKFVKDYNLTYSVVQGCLEGKFKQHKGWTFKKITN